VKLFSGDWRFEEEEITADRLRCKFIDDVARGAADILVFEDLALTGFDVTGLAGSRRLLLLLEFPRLLMTIPSLPEYPGGAVVT